MGLFSSGPSLVEIDRFTADQLDRHLGHSSQVGNGAFSANFRLMLDELKDWSDQNSLSLWKRSRIAGAIEGSLRAVLPGNVVPDLMKTVYTKLDMR